MEGREIPGFYYGTLSHNHVHTRLTHLADKEKKKYFAIRTNGSAASSSAYSSVDVKRRRIQDNKEKAAQAERERPRIRKSKYMNNALKAGLLEREFGEYELDVPQIMLGGYNREKRVEIQGEKQTFNTSSIFAVRNRDDTDDSKIDICAASHGSIGTFFLIILCGLGQLGLQN